jgi:hypothetical protein
MFFSEEKKKTRCGKVSLKSHYIETFVQEGKVLLLGPRGGNPVKITSATHLPELAQESLL